MQARAWASIAATTLGCVWPTLSVPMPAAKSMIRRPSASVMSAPRPSLIVNESAWPTPRGTAAARRAMSVAALDAAPVSVTPVIVLLL